MIPIKSEPFKEAAMAHDITTMTRIDELIAESRRQKEKALRIQKRINEILGEIAIDCGIDNKEGFLDLIERIAGDPEITTKLKIFVGSGARIWVNYGELMKEKCQIADDGSFVIAHNSSLDHIREYLGLLQF